MLTLLLLLVQAATPVPAASQPCAAPEHRQFDFWIGDWEVRSGDGRLLGNNRITSILSGCALQEEWTPLFQDHPAIDHSSDEIQPRRGRIHPRLVPAAVLRVERVVRDAADLRVRAGSRDGEAKTLVQRITWTPLPDGGLRQLWETSADAGSTWKTVFDGYYSRKARPQ